MYKIRQGVFETNSSSCHALSISPSTDLVDTDFKENTLWLYGGDFGWGYETLTSWLEKANYLAVETADSEGRRETLVTALKEVLGDITIEFDVQDSYIDHQSADNIWSEIESGKVSAKEVIFSPGIEIIIDHDNH